MEAGIREQVEEQIAAEIRRLYAPLYADPATGISWKELNSAIAKGMQNYCGGVKCDALLGEGLDLLESFRRDQVPRLYAENPHDLMRVHEVLDILTVAELVLHASLLRKHSSTTLCFERSDSPLVDPEQERHHIVIRRENGQVQSRKVPLDFFGDLKSEYEKHNPDYGRPSGEVTGAEHVSAGTRTWKLSEEEGAEPVFARTGAAKEEAALGNRPVSVSFVPCSARPITYDPEACIGCNRCVSVCQCDILMPAPKKGEHPVVMYPGECYYCGACVMVCPKPGAIRLQHPLMNQAKFVDVKGV